MGMITHLNDVLDYARLEALPLEYGRGKNKDLFWCLAIVQVYKYDMSRNYALAYNVHGDTPVIFRDFGTPAGIVKVEKIYPFKYLAEDAIPKLTTKRDILEYLVVHERDEDEIRALLSQGKKDGGAKTEEEKSADVKKLRNMVIASAMEDEIESMRKMLKI